MLSDNTGTSEVLIEKVDKVHPSILPQVLSHKATKTKRRRFVTWIKQLFRVAPTAPWVALLGLDGSGKSTVLQELEVLFSPPLFAGVQVFYRHPGFLYTHRLQTIRQNNHSGDEQPIINHYAKPPHGKVASITRLGILALDWLVGYWVQIAPQQAKGRVVIFDRYYWLDLLVDPLRYRYSGPTWLAHLAKKILPKPDVVILLDASIEVLQSRKQEVPSQEAARQQLAYLELVQVLPNSYIVDVSKSLEQVVSEVQHIILNYTNTPASAS